MGRGRNPSKRRRLVGSDAISGDASSRRPTARCYMDLHVPLPRGDSSQAGLSVRQLFDRLESTGFSRVALTHTIYGPPKLVDDSLHRIKQSADIDRTQSTTLYRLHAVIENLSDVGLYTAHRNEAVASTKLTSDVSKQYDLISISPRNDAVFQATCSTATAAEIITLDYASNRGQLPFKITRSDIRTAMARNAVFEIPLAAACLNRNLRKGLIQTCRMLQLASLGLKPRIIFSSGERHAGTDKTDAGPLALRMPGDMINLVHTILGWDSQSAVDALSTNGAFALEQGRRRRFGESLIVKVSQSPPVVELSLVADPDGTVVKSKTFSAASEDTETGEDGFISL